MSRRKGFSIIEVMITVSLLAVLAGVATTTFPSLLEKHRLSLAVKEFVGQLNLKRSRSILENKSYQLKISNHFLETYHNSVLVQSYALPREFTYVLSGSIYFHGKGIASPKTTVILSPTYSHKVVININGRIRSETSY